ncbi:MAG: hypothetical protein Kow0060_05570 [Methylohalobius crimeensis]
MKAAAGLPAIVGLIAVVTGIKYLLANDRPFLFGIFFALALMSSLVILWRGWRRQHEKKRSNAARTLVGRRAEVRQRIPVGRRGDVLIDGVLWLAIAAGKDKELQRGDRVRVSRVKGALLVVEPLAGEAEKSPAPPKERRQSGC